MPFTEPIDRVKMNKKKTDDFCFFDDLVDIKVGDRCYHFYKKMVECFEIKTRWTTAHNIYKKMIKDIEENNYSTDTNRAYELAWQVFFQLHVIPYELGMRKKNGDI